MNYIFIPKSQNRLETREEKTQARTGRSSLRWRRYVLPPLFFYVIFFSFSFFFLFLFCFVFLFIYFFFRLSPLLHKIHYVPSDQVCFFLLILLNKILLYRRDLLNTTSPPQNNFLTPPLIIYQFISYMFYNFLIQSCFHKNLDLGMHLLHQTMKPANRQWVSQPMTIQASTRMAPNLHRYQLVEKITIFVVLGGFLTHP